MLAERVVLLAHTRHARILRALNERAASHVLDIRAGTLQQQATALQQLVCALLVAATELVCIFLLRIDDRGEFLGLGSHYGIYGRLYVRDFARRLREAAKLVLERMNLLAKLLAYGLLVLRRLLVLACDARRGGEHFLEFLHTRLVDYDLLDDLFDLDRNLLDHFLLDDLLDGDFLDHFLFHYLLDRNLDDLLDNLLNGNFDDFLDDLGFWFDLR